MNGKSEYEFLNVGAIIDENININEVKKTLNVVFREYKKKFKDAFKFLGLNFLGFKYYVPYTYNYEVDCIDVILSNRMDKKRIKQLILKNKNKINKELSNNKSYDGYTALTSYDVNEAIEKLDKDDLDILVMTTLFKIYFNDLFENFKDDVIENAYSCENEYIE